MAPAIRERVSGIDRTQPIYQVQTLEQTLADSICASSLQYVSAGGVRLVAWCWAVVGIYGVMSYIGVAADARNRRKR